jgi:Mrp family chromosome partitioning ATPase
VQGCFVLGITGVPEVREQKSRVAAEIALALGEARHPRVLLVEGDFQWPAVHRMMKVDMPRSSGFSQQLRSQASGHSHEWTTIEVGPSLHVIAEGIMRSPGLILSRHFEDSLRSFRNYYDFVVVDGPLTSSEVDCRALDGVVDGIVIVAPPAGSPWLPAAMAMFPEKRFSTVVTAEG